MSRWSEAQKNTVFPGQKQGIQQGGGAWPCCLVLSRSPETSFRTSLLLQSQLVSEVRPYNPPRVVTSEIIFPPRTRLRALLCSLHVFPSFGKDWFSEGTPFQGSCFLYKHCRHLAGSLSAFLPAGVHRADGNLAGRPFSDPLWTCCEGGKHAAMVNSRQRGGSVRNLRLWQSHCQEFVHKWYTFPHRIMGKN